MCGCVMMGATVSTVCSTASGVLSCQVFACSSRVEQHRVPLLLEFPPVMSILWAFAWTRCALQLSSFHCGL